MTKEGDWVAPSAVVNTPKGLAVVCYEGVGWFEDEGMYKILVGDEYSDWVKSITKDELLSIISNEETTLHKMTHTTIGLGLIYISGRIKSRTPPKMSVV